MFIVPSAIAAAALAIGLSSAPAYAADPAKPPDSEKSEDLSVPASAQAQPKPGKVLYCMMTEVSGTRIRTKLCLTKAKWEERGVDVTAK